MRLPRRVPWSSLAELDELCSWIYSEDADFSSKSAAVRRLASWKFSTPLPHALDSAHAILSAILQDESSHSASSSSFLSSRHSYALALTRLVNGLVDPLQQGMYARPISAIAAQIGLPAWFVELRHSATHEELPSLDMLREGANQAMLWLLDNYFLPTLSPLVSTAPSVPSTPISPLLKQYKTLLKQITRDASLRSRSKPEMEKLLRDIERWIGEVKIGYSKASSWHAEDEEASERWAMDALCEGLLANGILPKKKRDSIPKDIPSPPSNASIWSPLLEHLHSQHSLFASQFLSYLVSLIFNPPSEEDSGEATATLVAGWILWVVEKWEFEGSSSCSNEEVASSLVLGLIQICESSTARTLLQLLAEGNPALQLRVSLLLSLDAHDPQARLREGQYWTDEDLSTMDLRLNELNSKLNEIAHATRTTEGDMEAESNEEEVSSRKTAPAPGWTLLGKRTGWRECPIGDIADLERAFPKRQSLPFPQTHPYLSMSDVNDPALSQAIQTLGELAHALTQLGVSAIDPQDKDGEGAGNVVLHRVEDMVEKLAKLDELKDSLTTDVPFDVLVSIDGNWNPNKWARKRIERAALENQYTAGKINALQEYQALLGTALAENFPELSSHLEKKKEGSG